jgi:hypothetical protein
VNSILIYTLLLYSKININTNRTILMYGLGLEEFVDFSEFKLGNKIKSKHSLIFDRCTYK